MFFYVSKILWFVAQPSAALILLLLAGILLVGAGAVRSGSVCVLLSALGFVVAGFLPLGPALLLPLENRFPRGSIDGPVTGILVLGGGIDQDIGRARGISSLVEAGDRMTEGVAMARRYPEARLVFTGGTAELIPSGETEGQAALIFFREMGIDESRITLEDKSRDTAENARFTKVLVDPKPGERWLLVTSAWHMPRAVGCFRAVGWPVTAWPTDYRTRGAGDLVALMPHPSSALNLVDTAMKEWTGLVAYRLAGRTDALFPGPN